MASHDQVNEYANKPIDAEVLIQDIAKHLHSAEGNSNKSNSPLTSAAGPAAISHDPPVRPTTDAVRSQFLHKPAVCRVLPEFVEGLPIQVAQIQHFLNQHDMDSLRRLVHQLRGSGGAYGFPDITQLATAAETSIDQQNSLDAISARVEELVNLVRRVEGYEPSKEQCAPA